MNLQFVSRWLRLAIFCRMKAMQLALVASLVLVAGTASAVPSFARQTGQACGACHVGGFGPQLTDFGISFKLGGYTLAVPDRPAVPVAAMLMTGLTHTNSSQDPSSLDGRRLDGSHLAGNDNLTLDQASLFFAGRLAARLGIFSQLTYDGVAQHTSIDNVDLRLADTVALPEDHSLLAGVSINNNPGLQDPFNTLPAWAFPYISSPVAPGPSASTVLDEAWAQKATGIVAYGQLDNFWYGELGTYRMQSVSTQKFFGIGPEDRDAGALRSPIYARLAVRPCWSGGSLNAGVVLFKTGYQGDRSLPDTTHYTDLGIDASWRQTADGASQWTALASVVHEASSGTSGLTEYAVTGSYYRPSPWGGSWGGSLQRFGVNASDLASRGTRLQLDWTPTGGRPLHGLWDPSVRVGLQFTAYDELDSARGHAAAAADAAYVFAWLAF
jgi:hypothetical protein